MLYRARKHLRTQAFNRAISGILDTPPIQVVAAPWCIVSMVANGDVPMYLLGLKSFYSKLGRGKVAAIIDRDMPQGLRDTLARHIVGLEFVILEDIPTGACQRGGTWERLLYILDRSEREYTIQLDSDTLTVGDDLHEVAYCVETNTPFTISDGFELMSLPDVAEEAEATPSDYIGIVTERMFAHYPGSESLRYIRGSSGFAGFARDGFTRAAITRFHQEMERLVGEKRWREWGTEQCGSNFAVANSPGVVVLPRPEYASFTPRVPRREVKLFHFIGQFRFLDGYYAARGREVIAQLRPDSLPASPSGTAQDKETRPGNLPLAFMRTLTLGSALRYLPWQALGQRYSLWLRSKSGPEFQLRPRSCGNRDADFAYEIFVHRYLTPPVWIPPECVKLIVDLGANIGFSCLHWFSTYWRAEVIAFEACPLHAAQFHVNLARSGFESRTTLYAGTADVQVWNAEKASSSQSSEAESDSKIEYGDIFPVLIGRRIDILKIDIAGGEYELLADPRFGALDLRAIVVKWHPRDPRAGGQDWCGKRLRELGFRVYPVVEKKSFGMMWGYKRLALPAMELAA